MSAHDGMVEGLPFHLDYIVRNKRAQIKCPYCSSKNTARILYGYPAYSEELQKKLDNGKIAIGGCCISGAPVDGGMIRTDPEWIFCFLSSETEVPEAERGIQEIAARLAGVFPEEGTEV